MNMHGTFFLTDLADAARSTGLQVIEVPGWQTRSAAPNRADGSRYAGGRYGGPGMQGVESLTIHHTATPENYQPGVDYPTYRVILQGNGSTGGPLSQLGHCRCGEHLYVFAAGICWHAGAVRQWWQGNPYSIGIEAEHSGIPRDMPWPKRRYDGYVQAAHGIAKWYGIPNARVVGHKESSTTGKIDPLFSMPAFRRDVAAFRGAAPAPQWPTGWIRNAQKMLNALGYTDAKGRPLAEDDNLGPATQHATKNYQRDAGLDPDGKPGNATTASLEEDMASLDDIKAQLARLEKAATDKPAPTSIWDERIRFQPGTSLHKTFGDTFRAGALLGYAAQFAYAGQAANQDELLEEIRRTRQADEAAVEGGEV